MGLTMSGAKAADLPPMPGLYSDAGPEAELRWEGSYAGLQIGAGQMLSRVKTGGTKKDFDTTNAVFGAFVGHNWQFNQFVLGLEADATFNGHKKSFNHASLGRVKAKNNWSVGAKARAGVAIGRVLPYLSAGLTASDYQLTANGTKKSSNAISLNLGGGLEYAVNEKVSLRADYSLHGLNDMTHNFGGTSVKSEAAEHRLMLGVAYRF